MKSLFVTLLILAAAFVAYDYFLAPPQERLIFKNLASSARQTAKDDAIRQETAAARADTGSKQSEVGNEAARPPASKPVDGAPTGAAAVALAPEEAPGKFHPPKFDPIEALTANWREVPKSAFPRVVKILKDTNFTFSVGTSLIRAGAEVLAVGMENGLLVVSPGESSPARQSVAVDDTDLKPRLVSVYEQWKIDRVEEARRAFEELQRRPKPTSPPVDEMGKPVLAADGTYPLLMARLRTGQPSEITPFNIVKWGKPEHEVIKGAAMWTIEVQYKARTMFGEMYVDTLVHVQEGRVRDWVFKGSGEPVP